MKFLLEDKVCRAEIFSAEESTSITVASGRNLPLVFMFIGDYTDELDCQLKEYIVPQIRAGKVSPFILASYGPVDWDKDYSPWYAVGSKGRIFYGGAKEYVSFIQERFLPKLKEIYPVSEKVYTLGYSLGGLAALYYYYELELSGCISCSGSLWYPGWREYLEAQLKRKNPVIKQQEAAEQTKDRIYLSLGGKEKNTSDVFMCHIEECTKETYERLKAYADVTFVHEPGGHMCKVNLRLAHGLCWLFNNKGLTKG